METPTPKRERRAQNSIFVVGVFLDEFFVSFRDKTRNTERERERERERGRERERFVLGYGNKSVFILIKKHCNVMYRVTE